MCDLSEFSDITNRALGGLEAGDDMWREIRRKAEKKPSLRKHYAWIPAVACAALLVIALSIGPGKNLIPWNTGTTGTAGDARQSNDMMTGSVSVSNESNSDEYDLILLNGSAYRMTGEIAPESVLGEKLCAIEELTATPSLSSGSAVSSVVGVGTEVYAVNGANGLIAAKTIDAGPVVFQRTESFGKNEKDSLESMLCAPEQVQWVVYQGKSLEGEKAEEALRVLYSHAERLSESHTGGETVELKLKNGLTMTLSAGDECLWGCGTWYCPEFFACFAQ